MCKSEPVKKILKNLYFKKYERSKPDFSLLHTIPFIGPNNRIGSPIRPINIIFKYGNSERMTKSFVTSYDFFVHKSIVRRCVNRIRSIIFINGV